LNYLSIEHASKSFGEKVLFDNVTLHISKGDKIALVAKNGSGKTTLLKVVAGEEAVEGEQASIFLHKSVRVGYLPQEPDMPDEQKVLDYLLDSDDPALECVRQYHDALISGSDDLQDILVEMDRLKAWSAEAKLKEVAGKLGIERFDHQLGKLSGGQRKRLALARLIFEDPEFLILDEPTNHLDLQMIEWLEDYLKVQGRTVFMVTHDRYFLDRVCNHIVELDHAKIHKYQGNYSDFLEKRAIRLENDAVVHEKTKKLMKRELDWVRRMPKARTTKSKARVDKFFEIKQEVYSRQVDPEMSIDLESERLGSKIVELHNVSKRFGDKIIVEDFDYKFKKGEKVGIIGKNGSGKTTLINILTKTLRPDSGKVVIGDTVVFGHYTQEGIQLKGDRRVIDVVRDIADYLPLKKGRKLTAEQLLERFLFPRPQQRVYVSKLSGGERRRLYLLTVLMANPNFLILDEPTNDLDILTLNVLENFLMDFPGCVIIVSHDRYFMDKLVDHLFVLDDSGHIRDFPGTYTEYRNEVGTEVFKSASKVEKSQDEKPAPQPVKKASLSYFEKKELNDLDELIPILEKRKSKLLEQFNSESLTTEQAQKLSLELGQVQDQLAESEDKWLELMEKKEG
jgi:ATP-binding cassette subfamily F protein uup